MYKCKNCGKYRSKHGCNNCERESTNENNKIGLLFVGIIVFLIIFAIAGK